MGGARKGSGVGKSGYYKGVYCSSTYELVWVIYQTDHEVFFERNWAFFLYSGHKRYYPDFKTVEGFVEIKGWIEDENVLNNKLEAVRKAGHEIKLLMQPELCHCFNWVKTNYSYRHLQELYDEHKPKYTCTCTNCGVVCNRDVVRKFCSRECAGKFRKRQNNTKQVNDKIRLAMLKYHEKRKSGAPTETRTRFLGLKAQESNP